MRFRILLVATLIFCGLAQRPAVVDGGDDQFFVASSHYGQGRWRLAAKEFDALVRQFPLHRLRSDAMFFAGESLVQLGDYPEATHRYRRFLQSAPKNQYRRNAQYRLAEVFYIQDRHQRARAEFAKFSEAYPDDSLMQYVLPYLGSSCLELADDEQPEQSQALVADAQARFTEAIRRFPTGPLIDECRFGMARTAHLRNDIHLAQNGYTPLLLSPRQKIAQQSRYHLAAIHFERNEFKLAAQHYSNLIETASDSRWAKAARGPWLVSLVRSGQFEKAQATFAQWANSGDIQEVDSVNFLHLADAAFTADKLDWAGELFQRLAADKQSADYRARGLSGLAWVQHRKQQNETAVDTFAELLVNHPNHEIAAEAAFMRAALLEKLDRKSAAADAYRVVVDQFQNYDERPQALYRLGVLCEETDKKRAALESYRQLLSEYGDDWEHPDAVLFRIAWLEQRRGRQREAIAAFKSIYEDHRGSKFWPEATYRLAKHEFENGQHKAARAQLTEILSGEPPAEILAHALYLDARASQIAGNWGEVEKSLSRVIADVPDSALRLPACFWLAEAVYQQDRFDEARQLFRKLSNDLEGRTDHWVPTVRLRSAQLLAMDKKWPQALEAGRSLLAAHRDTAHAQEVHFLIGRCLAAQARFDQARDAYLKAAPRDGSLKNNTAAQAQWMIGESYMHQDNYQRAIEEYFRVEALFAFPRWQAAALLQAAKCHEHLNESAEAIALYRRILTNYPDTSFVPEATQRLRAAKKIKP
ncbi:MAG: tetratricopeptide repeat protein [Pirellulales bacterium]